MSREEHTSLAAHPRLCLGPEGAADRGRSAPAPRLRAAVSEIAAQAKEYVTDPDFAELLPVHNAHLIRARKMQARVLTLVAQWLLTGDPAYRDSASAHLLTIGRWKHWSWIAERRGDTRPDAIFDLSYGENSTTLAFGYDLLYDHFSDEQRSAIRELALNRSLRPFLRVLERNEAWWFQKPDSNWNTVCAGGAGMLALAFYDELDEARAVLPIVEDSIRPYMQALERTDGGWPEGVGYWFYGMRYAFLYLLSYERATGRHHPLMRTEGTRRTLRFPLDFCPHGQSCSFGDGNDWVPLPFHFAAAGSLGDSRVVRELYTVDAKISMPGRLVDWPVEAEQVLLDQAGILPADDAPTDRSDATEEAEPVRVYNGLGWARMADRWPDPRLYLSIRGGTVDVPHGHRDLLSFHAVVGDERLIENVTPAEYLDTTFGPRRFELFEMGPHSKNVPLINGVGIVAHDYAEPVIDEYRGYPGIRLDATNAVGGGRDDEPLARFCGRAFLLFGQHAALVVDRIELWHEGRVESRLHTRANVRTDGHQAVLTGRRQVMTVAFAANVAFGLSASPTLSTTPGDEATVLRWSGPHEMNEQFWMATLLVPGETDARARLEPVGGGVVVHLDAGDWSERVRLTDRVAPEPSENAQGDIQYVGD